MRASEQRRLQAALDELGWSGATADTALGPCTLAQPHLHRCVKAVHRGGRQGRALLHHEPSACFPFRVKQLARQSFPKLCSHSDSSAVCGCARCSLPDSPPAVIPLLPPGDAGTDTAFAKGGVRSSTPPQKCGNAEEAGSSGGSACPVLTPARSGLGLFHDA